MTRLFPAAILICAAATSCAGLRSHESDDLIAVLDATGVAEPAYVVDSGSALTFVNADSRPHQIYSPECPELDSTLLRPGESFRAALGTGPKVCHFQDLLAPASSTYAGTVEVRFAPRDPIFADSPA
jgi:hypothetical protein